MKMKSNLVALKKPTYEEQEAFVGLLKELITKIESGQVSIPNWMLVYEDEVTSEIHSHKRVSVLTGLYMSKILDMRLTDQINGKDDHC